MRITKQFLIALLLACSIHAFAQKAIQSNAVKSPQGEKEFMYKGKPISPEMIIPFFPDPADSSSQAVVNLDHALMYQVNVDTVWTSGIKWLNPNQARRAYTCMGDDGLVSYVVLHNISPNRFVILGCLSMGATDIRFYTFVVDIRGNKLVKTGQMRTDNVKEYSVDLKNNTLIYHDNS